MAESKRKLLDQVRKRVIKTTYQHMMKNICYYSGSKFQGSRFKG